MERTLVIEPSDAVKSGLPAARITLDLDGLPLMPFKFPDAKTYFSLSGPPGGPLFVVVKTIPKPINDNVALEELVRAENSRQNLTLGSFGDVSIQGTRYPALLYYTGTQHAATAACALVIPAPSANASAPGLLLIYGRGGLPGSVPDCASVAAGGPLEPVLERLKWDLAIDPSTIKIEEAPKTVAETSAPQESQQQEQTQSPPIPEKAPQQQSTPAALIKFFGEIKETLKRMNCWHEGMPTSEAYMAWSPLQQQMWSMQSTLLAVDGSLQQAAQRSPNEPVFGIVEMFGAYTEMLKPDPNAAELVKLLERGPRA